MGIFSGKKDGPIQAWGYKDKLYRTKEARDQAERSDKFDQRKAMLVRVLAGHGHSGFRYIGKVKTKDQIGISMYETGLGDTKTFEKVMTPDQFASHLLAHWKWIRENVDKILEEEK